jgi:hypothetical protein
MRSWFLLAIVSALASSPVAAAPISSAAPQPERVDPAALAAANRMLTAMGYDRMMQRTIDAMVVQMGPMFKKTMEAKTGEQIDDALVTTVTGIESNFLRKMLVDSPDLRQATAIIYARAFTAAELDHMVELYRDPVMRKWSEVAPDMSAQMLPLIHGAMDSHRKELEEEIATAVTDYYAAKNPTPAS